MNHLAILKVFVSHSTQDREFVEQEVIPLLTNQGCEVFYSPDSIVPADKWERTILKGLKECDTFLLVMSPQSAQSPWVKREVDWIFHKGGKTIIPVLLEQCDADDFHIGMVSIQHVDFIKDRLAGRQHLLKSLGQSAASKVLSVRGTAKVTAKRSATLQANAGRSNPVNSQSVAAVPKHSDTIATSIGLKLKLIPSGWFTMGSPDSDEMARVDEKPQHRVEIKQPFYLGIHPVSQAEYEMVMGSNPRELKGNARSPLETVNWFDAVGFCNRLSEVEKMKPFYKISGENVSIVGGNGYRLPTEAEWEYACRAGTTTRWFFGDDESKLEEYGWYGQNSNNTTHRVGEKIPSRWGLHDMYGNVLEWCWDWFGSDYYKQSPVNDPSGPKQGKCRVLRGGSFANRSSNVRSACRYNYVPTLRSHMIGFRLART